MNRPISIRLFSFVLMGWLISTGLAPSSAIAADRTAAVILGEIDALNKMAPPPRNATPDERSALLAKLRERNNKRVELIGELYKSDPDNPALAMLLPQRWEAGVTSPTLADSIRAELKETVATSKNPKYVQDASWFLVRDAFVQFVPKGNLDAMTPVLDDFLKKYPDDPRGTRMLVVMANQTKALDCSRKQKAAVGKPFELDFADATKGSRVSIKGLKGKVVVIDFWATWCGPCVKEMPNMKKLYAEFKDKGVEFIGVSLDQPKENGGLDRLKDFVATNDIQWPQYYQGNYWQSDFSASWGINSIPCVFLIDADGNLASVEARGKLETLIPEYLAKAKRSKTGIASTP